MAHDSRVGEKWVGAWAPGLVTVDKSAFKDQTLRLIVRPTLGGKRLRIRLSNLCGNQKLTVGGAHIALRDGTSERNRRRHRPQAHLRRRDGGGDRPRRARRQRSRSISMSKRSSDLAVSLYIPGDVPENLPITGPRQLPPDQLSLGRGRSHRRRRVAGQREDRELVFPQRGRSPRAGGNWWHRLLRGFVTEGNFSSLDSNSRWPDQLARRLVARGGRVFGVMNQGIGGNRILHDMRGDSGLRRFDRDVLAQPGVTHAIVYIGTNDLRNQRGNAAEVVTTEQMIGGLKQLALRAKTGGLTVYGATMIPYENETYFPGAWTPQGEAKRQAINGWMRAHGGDFFDALIDFDKAVLDPAHPTSMRAEYDCGDHLHPSDTGYRHMGDAIDLKLFE